MGRLAFANVLLLTACAPSQSVTELRLTLPAGRFAQTNEGRTFESALRCDDEQFATHDRGAVIDNGLTISVRPCGGALLDILVRDASGVVRLSGRQRLTLTPGALDVVVQVVESGELDLSVQDGRCAATITPRVPTSHRTPATTQASTTPTRIVLPAGDYDVTCRGLAGAAVVRGGELATLVLGEPAASTLLANLAVSQISQTAATVTWTRLDPSARVDVLLNTSDDLAGATAVATMLDAESHILAGLTGNTAYHVWIRAGAETVGPQAFTTLSFPAPTVVSTSLAPFYPGGTTSLQLTLDISEAVTGVDTTTVTIDNGGLVSAVEAVDAQTYTVTLSNLHNNRQYTLQIGGSIVAVNGGAALVPYEQSFFVPPFRFCVSNTCGAVTNCNCSFNIGPTGVTGSAMGKAFIAQAGDPTQDVEILIDAGTHSGSTVDLAPGMSILGGYTTAFTSRDPVANVTTITGVSPMVRSQDAAVGPSSVVDGLTIRSAGGGAMVAVRVTAGSPLFTRNDISGPAVSASSTGVEITGGAPTFRNNKIADAVTSSATGGDTRYAVYIEGPTSAVIEDNVITMASSVGSPTANAAVRINGNASVVRRNLIAGAASIVAPNGLHLTAFVSTETTPNTTPIVNNIIRGGGGSNSRGVFIAGLAARPLIVNNHIDAGAGSTSNTCIENQAPALPLVTNNLLFANTATATAVAFREFFAGAAATDSSPASLQNNGFGPNIATRYRNGAGTNLNLATIHALDSDFSGNFDVAGSLSMLFVTPGTVANANDLTTKDYRAIDGAVLRFGKDARASTCGDGSDESCGGEGTDFTAVTPRTNVFSVGAYEQD